MSLQPFSFLAFALALLLILLSLELLAFLFVTILPVLSLAFNTAVVYHFAGSADFEFKGKSLWSLAISAYNLRDITILFGLSFNLLLMLEPCEWSVMGPRVKMRN